MVSEKIQAVLDKEKPWFDLARMALTALGFAIACVVGVRYVVQRHGANHVELVMYLLPLVGPVVYSIFLILKMVHVMDQIIDVAFPRILAKDRPMYSRVFLLIFLFFVTYSSAGLAYLIVGAIPQP